MSKEFDEYREQLELLIKNNIDATEHTLIDREEYQDSFQMLEQVVSELQLPDECDLATLVEYENWLKEQG